MNSDIDVIWSQTLDDIYLCEVKRTTQYWAKLSITEISTSEVKHAEDVYVLYGAMFGPDIADVEMWQDLCVSVIDELIETQDVVS